MRLPKPAFGEKTRFRISLAIIVAALISSIATFLILNGLTPIVPTTYIVLGALSLTATLVLVIIGIVGFQTVKILKARSRQAAGAGLHLQMAGIFSLVALFPAILLAFFATVSIEHNFDALFSNRVKGIVSNSVEVAQSYLAESGQVIRSDMLGIARELEENTASFRDDRASFGRLFSGVVSMRNLPSAFLIDSQGNLLLSAASDGTDYRVPPPPDIARAADGRIVPLSWDLSNGMAALKKLSAFDDLFLYVIRPVNPNVYRLLQRTQINILEFAQLEQARGRYRDRLRDYVCAPGADAAHLGRLDGPCLRKPPGDADPQADRRRAGGEPGQSQRSSRRGICARRHRQARRDLQKDDGRSRNAARGAHERQHPARRAAALHRGGAGGRDRWRHRARCAKAASR